MTDIKKILMTAIENQASDVHINVGMPPVIRKNTKLVNMNLPPVTNEDAREMVLAMLGKDKSQSFEEKRDIDFSTTLEDGYRFRVNAHYQRDTIAIAFRVVPNCIPEIEDLQLPPIIKELADLPR
ncbi:MAG: type IV pili twitching motility protein PilT, partial [Planctomycetota bacterium]